MNFDLNDDQVALQASVQRVLAERHGHERRRQIASGSEGSCEQLWTQLAGLGVPALTVPEAHGGLGGTGVELMLVMQEIGRSLLATPWLGSCVLPVAALLALEEEAAAPLLPALASGDLRIAWAHDEADAEPALLQLATRARLAQASAASAGSEGPWLLSGAKRAVLHAGSANHYLVSAHLDKASLDSVESSPVAKSVDGPGLFLVDAGAPGLRLRACRLIDGTPAAQLLLDGTPARPLCLDAGRAASAIAAATATGVAASCAEMLGCMEAALQLSLEYLNTRQQFGRAIGQNQALRHKLADMQLGLELARSMACAAAVQLGHWPDMQARLDLSRAKLVIGRHARALTEAAIQLHGGIGMTEEYPVGSYLRRVHVLDQLFGDTRAHAHGLMHLDRAPAPSACAAMA